MFKTIFQAGLVGSFILLSGCGGGGSDSGGGEQDVNLASECIATPAAGTDFIRAQNTCDFAVSFSIHFSTLEELGTIIPLAPNQSSNPFPAATIGLESVSVVACRSPTNPQLESNVVVCR